VPGRTRAKEQNVTPDICPFDVRSAANLWQWRRFRENRLTGNALLLNKFFGIPAEKFTKYCIAAKTIYKQIVSLP